MRARILTALLCAMGLGISTLGAYAASDAGNWPAWRGPNGNGLAAEGNPPTTWSDTENIKWKFPLTGASDSTPIIWGDKIFFQTAFPIREDKDAKRPNQEEVGREVFTATPTVPYKFNIVCLDRGTGKLIWEKTVTEVVPHEGIHPSTSMAAYSPVTDGKLLWANFGSRGLHCYDLDGNHKWSVDLIEMLMFRGFGEGSSPAIAGDAIVVLADHEGDSKIFAFDKLTGKKLWERDRDEGSSWTSPVPVEVDGRIQIVTSATNKVRSYDAETGDIVWECAGLTAGAIPTPVLGFGNVYCTTGYQKPAMMAIELGHTGDLTGSDSISWTLDENAPYTGSPLLYGENIYFTANLRPVISCYNAKTGEVVFSGERLTGMKQIYGSPTGAGGHVYISDRKGTTTVLKHGDTFEVVAVNSLDDVLDASPIVVGDELYLKGDKFLYCIAE